MLEHDTQNQGEERIPGLNNLLQKMGVSSADSDFHLLREQVRKAIQEERDFSESSPAHWEDPILEKYISDGSRVLDLGCGNGELLARLMHKKYASVQGVESNEELVLRCIERGIPVYHEDITRALTVLADQAFELAILENTLQTLMYPRETLRDMMRVAKVCAVSFPNFAHWSVRVSFSTGGRMPVTSSLPYTWYNTPNIHFCSLADFLDWANSDGVEILDGYVLVDGKVQKFDSSDRIQNITAEHALFFFRGKDGVR